MDLNKFANFAFDSKSGVIGAISGVNVLDKKVTIMVDEVEIVVADAENVTELEILGYIGEDLIVEHDVVATESGKLFELALNDKNEIQMFLLNKKFERQSLYDCLKKEELQELMPYVELVSNIHLLKHTIHTLDFNIKIVRRFEDGETTYFYTCNNIDKEEVDLIKVIFIGHKILAEEKYERITLSHKEYIEAIEENKFKEVSPQELMNYVTGMTYGKSEHAESLDDDDNNEDDYRCYECGCDLEECECEYDDYEEEEDDEDWI